MDEINEYNMLTVKEFLIGGEFGALNRIAEGFTTFTVDAPDNLYDDFSVFKENVQSLLELYAWDTKQTITIDRPPNPEKHVQVFDLPNDDILLQWFEEFRGLKYE